MLILHMMRIKVIFQRIQIKKKKKKTFLSIVNCLFNWEFFFQRIKAIYNHHFFTIILNPSTKKILKKKTYKQFTMFMKFNFILSENNNYRSTTKIVYYNICFLINSQLFYEQKPSLFPLKISCD